MGRKGREGGLSYSTSTNTLEIVLVWSISRMTRIRFVSGFCLFFGFSFGGIVFRDRMSELQG